MSRTVFSLPFGLFFPVSKLYSVLCCCILWYCTRPRWLVDWRDAKGNPENGTASQKMQTMPSVSEMNVDLEVDMEMEMDAAGRLSQGSRGSVMKEQSSRRGGQDGVRIAGWTRYDFLGPVTPWRIAVGGV